MSITDLDSLTDTVSKWLGGSSDPGFETAIQVGVQLTEADLNRGFISPDGQRCRGLRVQEMVTVGTATFDEKYEELPPGFLEMRAAYHVNDDTAVETPLAAVSDERIAWYDKVQLGCPSYYTVTGGLIRIAPRVTGETPTIRLVFYKEVPALLDGGEVTILTAYPQVYLHGTLAHMGGYLIDDNPQIAARVAGWKSMFFSAVLAANAAQRDRAGPYAA